MQLGDYVRVKGGSPRWCDAGGGAPTDGYFGEKLRVIADYPGQRSGRVSTQAVNCLNRHSDAISQQYLEPWVEGATWRDGEWHDPAPPAPAPAPAPAAPTLRDQFAMAALTGLLATSVELRRCYAKCAYEHADAMLAAREEVRDAK